MNRELLSKAVGNIDDRFIAEARFSVPEDASGASERIVHMKKKRIISLALAAALILALGVVAYAANWFGIRGLLRQDSLGDTVVYHDEDGIPNIEIGHHSGRLSISEAQDAPEEYREWIEKKTAAYEEWAAYYTEIHTLPEPYAPFIGLSILEEKPDGTVDIIIERDESGKKETISVSAEEAKKLLDRLEAMGTPYGNYGNEYGVFDAESEAKLLEIASKYGLTPRQSGESYTCATAAGNRYRSVDDILALLNAQNSGSVFSKAPSFFDSVVLYGNSGFYFNAYMPLTNGEHPLITGRFTPWTEMPAVGDQTMDIRVLNVEGVEERGATAADGTEVTIIADQNQVTFYAYLESGLFVGNWTLAHNSDRYALTEQDVDEIVNMLIYSNMG